MTHSTHTKSDDNQEKIYFGLPSYGGGGCRALDQTGCILGLLSTLVSGLHNSIYLNPDNMIGLGYLLDSCAHAVDKTGEEFPCIETAKLNLLDELSNEGRIVLTEGEQFYVNRKKQQLKNSNSSTNDIYPKGEVS